jgi:hypothetical protein
MNGPSPVWTSARKKFSHAKRPQAAPLCLPLGIIRAPTLHSFDLKVTDDLELIASNGLLGDIRSSGD